MESKDEGIEESGKLTEVHQGSLDEMLFEIEKRLMQEERAGSK